MEIKLNQQAQQEINTLKEYLQKLLLNDLEVAKHIVAVETYVININKTLQEASEKNEVDYNTETKEFAKYWFNIGRKSTDVLDDELAFNTKWIEE